MIPLTGYYYYNLLENCAASIRLLPLVPNQLKLSACHLDLLCILCSLCAAAAHACCVGTKYLMPSIDKRSQSSSHIVDGNNDTHKDFAL